MARRKRLKNAASSREMRRAAIRMADTDGAVRSISRGRWEVASESSPGSWYRVAVTEGGIVCDCGYHLGRKGAACKHSMAVEITMLQGAGEVEPGEPVTLEPAWPRCPGCGSENMRRDGTRPRGRREVAQRYKCREKACGVRFSDGPGFAGRHLPPEAILLSLMFSSMGISPGGITLMLDQQMNLKIHRTTVQRWADRYIGMVDRYTSGLRIRAGRKWSSDEKFVKVVGADHWVFTVMDMATRFVLSQSVSPEKMNYRAARLLEMAADRAGHIPLIFVTDRLQAFSFAFKKVFWRGRNPQPIHFRESHIRSRRCNNCHERFNGTLAERLGDGPRHPEGGLGAGCRQPALLQLRQAPSGAGRDHARPGREDHHPGGQRVADHDPARGAGRRIGGNTQHGTRHRQIRPFGQPICRG